MLETRSPGFGHGSEIARPTIATNHLEKYTIGAIHGEAKIIQILLKRKIILDYVLN